jgi:predicted 2-oxoglutarate/Fe(II)-dependent dioxygenase YbiX
MIDVPYSPLVKSLHAPKVKIADNIKKFGNITFTETLLYQTGATSPLHIDNGALDEWKKWTATGILFCNDTYDGGELYFSKLSLTIKPPTGTFILFPAGPDSQIYEHGVHTVRGGIRITTVFRYII